MLLPNWWINVAVPVLLLPTVSLQPTAKQAYLIELTQTLVWEGTRNVIDSDVLFSICTDYDLEKHPGNRKANLAVAIFKHTDR